MAAPDAPVIRARSNGLDVVRLTCPVPLGTDKFKVYRDVSPGPATTLLAEVTPADLTVPFVYTHAVGGAAGLIFHYRVKATNIAAGPVDEDSGFSNEVRVATEDYSAGTPTGALRINRTF